MTSRINDSSPKLIDQLNMMPKEDGKVIVSQQAQIGDKKVKITLEFEGHVTYDEAKRAMDESFEKVTHLTDTHKLGEVHKGEKTQSLTIHSDNVIRKFTYEKPHFFKKGSSKSSEMQKIREIHPENLLKSKDESSVTGVTPHPIAPKKISIRLATEEPGKVLTDKFEVNGRLIATEESERAGTVAMLANSLSAKMEYLNNKLTELQQQPKTPRRDHEIVDVQKELEKLKTDLGNFITPLENATHGSTNAPRLAFKSLEDAKTQMAPVLMNLRMQTVKNAAGEVISAVTRSGAISDFRNGEVSLQELKDLQNLQNRHDLPLEQENQLVRFYTSNGMPTGDATLLIKTKALIGYGPEALASGPLTAEQRTILKKVKSAKTLEAGFAKLNPKQKLALEKIAIDNSKLESVIADRSNFLKQLVLQDLLLHFQTTKANKDPILYNRTALVDLRKQAKTEYGCVNHERTQGLDMKAIFDELQDARVVFDCNNSQAAYIDHEGVIHMPTDCSTVSSATLVPVFFNVCVQGDKGHCLNTGMQQQINEQTLERLEGHYGKDARFQELKASLHQLSKDESMDPNRTALLINQFIQENNGYAGINCYGGKDRTGYELALITHEKIAEELKVDRSDPQMAEVKVQLLRSNGIASQTANDNVGEVPLKLTRYDLELYDTKTAKGKLHRIADGVNAAFVTVKPAFRGKLGLSHLLISPTPGQIYNESKPASGNQKMKRIFQHFSQKK